MKEITNWDDIPDDATIRITHEPIPDEHYAIIHCEKCNKFLAKLFADCQGCEIAEDFFSLCVKCWEKLK